MELHLASLFFIAVAGLGQQPPATTYTPSMCLVAQPSPVSAGYIHYCMDVSGNKVPSCPVVPQPKASGETYFEPLDCSWHSGKNPRIRIKIK